jgi:glycosyltransferase involved in cell wall biosynthesis
MSDIRFVETERPSPAERVLYVQYTNPAAYPPLEHSAEILADAGMDVCVFGTTMLADSLELKPDPRIRVRLHPYQSEGWRQKLNYLSFLLAALAEGVRSRPNWIYASDPLACPVALVLWWFSRARLVYHEHDSPDTSDGAPAPSLFMRLVLRARVAVGRKADVCVLPNGQRAAVFGRLVNRTDVLTVWNCPMKADVGPARQVDHGDRLSVLYHGSIVPSRLPVTVIDALAQLPSTVALKIGGYETIGHRGYVRLLLGRAQSLGIADRIEYVGTVPKREDLMRQCATCDVGLALLPADSRDPNERAMFGASNKPFDYLANGLPVLVADLPTWRDGLVEPGYGRSCDPDAASSIASALAWFLEHPEARVAMGERGRQRILSEWNYETAFAPVLRELTARASVFRPATAATNARV